ncbi:UDP-N-acetyl-D-glucosamine 6-dehydrogenase [Beauveria bassiana]|nr:UDP-N-acetyl-D-glucosamine 6-dehydrogenase [Beauveria bassiana]KAH8712415.1 UDP-N-acetyl-D-glucosamine 6-dehydrogenase [Beauveria bassiana]
MKSPPITNHVVEKTSSGFLLTRDYYDQTPPGEVGSEDEAQNLEPIRPNQEPTVAVIGVGYVGEHLVNAFAGHCPVIGFDVSASRIHKLQLDHPSAAARFTSKASDTAPATHFLIAVPTLLLPDQQVDSSYLRQAVAIVARHARPGSTVVIESSVAVGMTRALLGPVAAAKSLFAGMSPERVSRPEVAEMMKLYENCQRMVCIAYANEMADACAGHGIDPFEVCRAAATKPFGYLPCTPGLGVGGHCIPVNPFYLLSNNDFPLLQRATETMRARPGVLAQRIVEKLAGQYVGGARLKILVIGIGFKPGQAHLANSPGLELAKSVVLSGKVDVVWADALVAQEAVPQIQRLEEAYWSVTFLEQNFDYIVAATRPAGLDLDILRRVPSKMVEWWFA